MRIMFIEPPFYTLMQFQGFGFPVGLSMMGAILEEQGHEVQVVDGDFTRNAPRTQPDFLDPFYGEYLEAVNDENHPVFKELEERIQTFQPDIVGVGVMTPKVASAIRVFEAARRAAPKARLLVGGAHATIRAEEMLEACPEIDTAVKGDGFSLLPAIIDAVANDKPLPRIMAGDPSRVDFSSLPQAGRHLLDRKDEYAFGELGLMVTTMGCPWRCTFCSTHTIWNKKRASRSAKSVVDEMIDVHRTYGIGNFSILDDVFTLEKDKVREMCELLIEADLGINWTCCTHANIVHDDLIALMKKAGCTTVAIGIETGSPRMLKLVRKGLTHERVINAKNILEKHNMNWTGFFMVGLLNEGREDMYQTLDFMKKLDPPYAHLGVYANIPGTPLFEHGLELGITQEYMTRKEYFGLAPSRFYVKEGKRSVVDMTSEEYEKIAGDIMLQFYKHNHSAKALLKRAWRRRHDYLEHPKLFFTNVGRMVNKLGLAREAIGAEESTRNQERRFLGHSR